MSVRQLARWIDEHVHLDLQAAPFRKDDPALVPKAGPCTTCPKRVGSNPALFEDLKKKGDTCTDPTCYQAKLTAFTARRVEEATSSVGSEVVRISDRAYVYGADEKRLKDAGVLVKAEYTPGAGTWKPADSKICPHFKVAIVVDAENPSSLGQRKEVCASPQACAVHTDKIDRDIARANTQSDQRDKAKKQKVVRERKVRESILTAVRDKVTELATEDLRFVAISFVEEMHADRQKQTYRLMAWSEPTKEKKAFGGTFSDFKKALQRELGQASPELLARFLVTAALTRAAEVHEHWPTDPKPLYEAAKRWKVDADAIRWGFDAVDRAVTAKAKDKAGKAKKASKAAGVQTSARGGKPAKPPTVKRTKAKAVKRTKGRDV
jgi:ParB family chromosome partitioning protein